MEDADRTAVKTESLGGGIIAPPVDTQMGCFAILEDPQGTIFQVLAGNRG